MGGKWITFVVAGLSATAIATGPALAGGPGVGSPGPGPESPGPKSKPDKPDKADRGRRDETTILVQFAAPGYNNDDLVQQDGDQANGAVGDLKTRTIIVKLKRGADVDAKIAEYEARDDVLFAEANGYASAGDNGTYTTQSGQAAPPAPTNPSAASVSDPDDTYYSSQWGLAAIHAFDAWQLFVNGFEAPDGPPIAIVDSGVDSLHPDLFGKVATDLGASCLTGVCVSDGAADDYGHGTHVAGIAAARANDGVGVAGVAFNAPIIPVKVLDSTGSGTFASIASGIIWATDQGARVLNLSLGGTAYSQTVCDAVAYATSHGATVVAAAGNNGTSTAFYPAGCSGAIGVAATDSTDTRASFSETSYPNVFVSAPGVSIVSDYPNGSYVTDSGTSMASPFVAAVADILIAQDPSRMPIDVKRMLAGTADKVGTTSYASDPYATCLCTWNASYGYGRVNAYRALTEPAPAPAPDFALSGSTANVVVQRGKTAAMTVSTTSDSGFTSTAALSVSGLPAGVTASFNPTSITGVGNSTLTFAATTSAAYGTYPVTIRGMSGALTRVLQATVVVPAPDFTLKLSQTSATVVQSEKTTATVGLNNLFGFASTVYLSVSGAPAGVTPTLSRTSTSGTTAATLTLSTLMSTTPGTYDVTIKGTSGSLVRTAIITLTVAVAVPDFTLVSATMSSSVRYGRATTISYKLSLAQKYGFRGTVSMSVAGLPPGTSGTFTVPTVNITSTSTFYTYLSLPIPIGTPVGRYTLTITGTGSNGATHSVNPVITIS